MPLDVDVERVPEVPRRMVGWDVQHLEVGEVVLDLGALEGHEPEATEDLGDLPDGLDDRVERAAADRTPGGRDVDGPVGKPPPEGPPPGSRPGPRGPRPDRRPAPVPGPPTPGPAPAP